MHNLLPKSANPLAIEDAKEFMLHLPIKAKKPIVSLANDGEINFLWMLPDFRLDLGMYGDGSYSYYGKTANGKEFISDQEPITKPISDKILSFILSL